MAGDISAVRNSVEKDSPFGMYLRTIRMVAKNPRILQNVLRSEYRKRVGIGFDRRFLSGRSGLPSNISINLTRRCNLRCRMCIQHRHEQGTSEGLPWYETERELPVSAWVRLLDEAMEFRPSLFVTGGEPTLHPDFTEFIREAKRRRFVVHLATNGTTLTRYSSLLVEQGVDLVMVSLDGPQAVHDRIRGQEGLFERSTQGIRALVAERARQRAAAPLIGINCAISADNARVIEEMASAVAGLGIDSLQFQHTIFLSSEHVEKHNRLFSKDFASQRDIDLVPPSIPDGEFYESEIEAPAAKIIAESLERVKANHNGRRFRLSFLPNLSAEKIEPYYTDLNHPFGGRCNTLWRTLRILPDGTVSPCLHVVAGNILDKPAREIWNGPTMRGFRRLLTHKLLPGCARCCNRSFV